jgi:predicted membrane protein
MITEILTMNLFFIMSIFLGGVILTLSMSGFIGNININSGDGNVNISGVNAENEQIDQATEEIDIEETIGLLIENNLGSVNVSGHDQRKVLLTKTLYVPKATPEEERNKVKETFNGQLLISQGELVELKVPRMTVLSALGVKVDLEILVPKMFSLNHKPGNNDITIEDINGAINIQNNVGDIKLSNLPGELTVHSNSSTITGYELGNLNSISVNAGNISLAAIAIQKKDAKIQVNAGDIEADIAAINPDANCSAKVQSGDVLLSVNRELNATLDIKSNMGEVSLDPELKVISGGKTFMGHAVVAQLNEDGGKIDVSSMTGKIKVILK